EFRSCVNSSCRKAALPRYVNDSGYNVCAICRVNACCRLEMSPHHAVANKLAFSGLTWSRHRKQLRISLLHTEQCFRSLHQTAEAIIIEFVGARPSGASTLSGPDLNRHPQ